MTTETKLLPCPFCGGEAEIHNCLELANDTARVIYAGKQGVHCSVCGIATTPHNSEAEAIEAWNTRHERTESPNRMGILPCGAIWDGKAYCGKCGARVKED